MRKTTRRCFLALACVMTGGLLLGMAPTASAQRIVRQQRIVIVEPRPFFYDPFFPYGGFYPYPAGYAANYGEVKIDTHRKDAKVYVDGGYAGRIKDAKKLALRPGNHKIELRNSDDVTFFRETVAITVGHTTKLHVA